MNFWISLFLIQIGNCVVSSVWLFITYLRKSEFQLHIKIFSLGQKLFLYMEGSRMSPTPDRMGLLMTHFEGVYSFHCRSQNSCYWKIEDYTLKIKRKGHIMISLPIPEPILHGCKYPETNCTQCADGYWNLTDNGCKREIQLFINLYAQ